MPWQEVCIMDERMRFMGEYLSGEWTMSELCREYGISRKTGYKLVKRYEELGAIGLVDLSRAPHHHPQAVSEAVAEAILALKGRRPYWGPVALRARLMLARPEISWPAASTIGALLKRHGLVVARRRRRHTPPYREPFWGCDLPNSVWCADFKGWFRTADGARCDPFTLSDSYSRFLLRCQAVTRPDYLSVKPVFDAAFREYGLPRAIRTDNGEPFASTTVGGLSRLSIEWIKLGIVPERIKPGSPQENGRHERMHRTLKEQTAKPPEANLRAQQRAFDRFCQEYNQERPHQALELQTPAMLYHPSSRPFPARLPEINYPQGFLLRRVHPQGDLRWHNQQIYLSQTLAGEIVGLQQEDDRYWNVYFGSLKLATLDTFSGSIKRVFGTGGKKDCLRNQ